MAPSKASKYLGALQGAQGPLVKIDSSGTAAMKPAVPQSETAWRRLLRLKHAPQILYKSAFPRKCIRTLISEILIYSLICNLIQSSEIHFASAGVGCACLKHVQPRKWSACAFQELALSSDKEHKYSKTQCFVVIVPKL